MMRVRSHYTLRYLLLSQFSMGKSRTISAPCRKSCATSFALLSLPKSPLNLASASSNSVLSLSALLLLVLLVIVSFSSSDGKADDYVATFSSVSIDSLSKTTSSSFSGLLSPRSKPQYGAACSDGFLTKVLFIISAI